MGKAEHVTAEMQNQYKVLTESKDYGRQVFSHDHTA